MSISKTIVIKNVDMEINEKIEKLFRLWTGTRMMRSSGALFIDCLCRHRMPLNLGSLGTVYRATHTLMGWRWTWIHERIAHMRSGTITIRSGASEWTRKWQFFFDSYLADVRARTEIPTYKQTKSKEAHTRARTKIHLCRRERRRKNARRHSKWRGRSEERWRTSIFIYNFVSINNLRKYMRLCAAAAAAGQEQEYRVSISSHRLCGNAVREEYEIFVQKM